MKSLRIISTGFAMFAMLFGAANVVYPLALGRTVGEMVWFALGGFVISAVCIPFIGFVSALLFEGNYKTFFARVGQTPGFLLIMFCLMLIGPFFVSPRCLTISYASVQMYLPSISLLMFSLFAAALIFLATVRPGKVLSLLGKVLGPIKLVLLLAIIIKGLLKPTHFATTTFTPQQSFGLGFTEGFWTLDLLATIFFSGLLLSGLSSKENRTEENRKERFNDGMWAGLFGMSLLAIVYTGFCIVSAMHSSQLPPVDKVALLSALSVYILGDMGGLFANIVVSVACLTTAIALTSLFTDYLRREIFNKKLSHLPCLLITIAITVVMTSLGFDKLAQILLPIVLISYPAILVLAVVNIAYKVWGFSYVKTPFFIALVASVGNYYGLFARLLQ